MKETREEAVMKVQPGQCDNGACCQCFTKLGEPHLPDCGYVRDTEPRYRVERRYRHDVLIQSVPGQPGVVIASVMIDSW